MQSEGVVVHERHEEMYEAAVRYYIHNETMESIARYLDMSRSSVSRLLARARETGLVRITVAEHRGSSAPEAKRLTDEFGIRVHLADLGDVSPMMRLDRVCRMAAVIFSEALSDHMRVGIAWGVTLTHISRHLERKPVTDVTVVQLNGAANAYDSGASHIGGILATFSSNFNAKVVGFPVPAFFDYAATKEAMWQERSVRQVLDLQQRLDLAIFGVGALHGAVPSHVYTAGHLSAEELTKLSEEGVVGDVCTVLLREDGSWEDVSYNGRASGLNPSGLRRIPRRMCVAADPLRASAIVGALRAGVVTDLVVDDATAAAVVARL